MTSRFHPQAIARGHYHSWLKSKDPNDEKADGLRRVRICTVHRGARRELSCHGSIWRWESLSFSWVFHLLVPVDLRSENP